MSGTLDRLTEAFARTLQPLSDALSSTEEIDAWIASLGWTLPSVPPALSALSGPCDRMLDALWNVIDARERSGDDADLDGIGQLASGGAAFVAELHTLGDALREQLPADYLARTGIDQDIERRIVEDLVVQALASGAPLLHDLLLLCGIVEERPTAEDPSRMQPEHLHRSLHWERLPQLLTDPAGAAREVYGWGTPALDVERLFDALQRLSFLSSLSAEFRYPSRNFLQAAVPGALVPEDGPGPMIVFPWAVEVALVPTHAAAAADPQGVALALLPGGASFGDSVMVNTELTFSVDATLDAAAGLVAVIAPGRTLRIIADADGGNGTSVDGKLVAWLAFARAAERAPLTLLNVSDSALVQTREAHLTAGVEHDDAGTTDLFIEAGITGGQLVLDASDTDGFLAEILPSGGLRAEFDLGVVLSYNRGLHFSGQAGLEASTRSALSAGPFNLEGIRFSVAASGSGISFAASIKGGASVGPVRIGLAGLGLHAQLQFAPGNFGPVDFSLGLDSPDGVAVSLDAQGVLSGGGFLFHDAARALYAGAIQLSLYDQLTLKAYGLIATRLPDGRHGYSLLVFITAEDFRPIPLGLGFTLLGIGGMLGVHRSFDQDVLRQGLTNGTLASLLFPRDPVGNASALIQSLASAFPARRGSYLIGLLLKLGWLTPALVQMELALIREFGDRSRLLVLGRISALLPSADNDLVRLNMEALGVIDFDQRTAAIDAVLVDSRLAHRFPITGSAALRAGFTPGPALVLAVGGLNPHFAPPTGFPVLQRVAIALSSGSNPRLVCQGYFAITSNTVQFGAQAFLHASAAGFSVDGDVGFDVLVQIAPLHFIADFHAKLQLKRGSSNLFMVELAGELEGPRPLRLSGKATFKIFWFHFSVHFDATLAHGEPPPLPPAIDVSALLAQALAAPSAWHVARGAQPAHGVALRSLPPAAGAPLVLDPLGRLTVTQQVVPLNTARDIDIFGGAPVSGDRRFSLSAALNGKPLTSEAQQAPFAPAQYFSMSDDERLHAPSFESMDAGHTFGPPGILIDAASVRGAPLSYRTVHLGGTPAPAPAPASAAAPLPRTHLAAMTRSAAAARRSAATRFANTAAPEPAQLQPPRWLITALDGGPPVPTPTAVRTWSEHQAVLAALNRGKAAWQLLPAHEALA